MKLSVSLIFVWSCKMAVLPSEQRWQNVERILLKLVWNFSAQALSKLFCIKNNNQLAPCHFFRDLKQHCRLSKSFGENCIMRKNLSCKDHRTELLGFLGNVSWNPTCGFSMSFHNDMLLVLIPVSNHSC